MTPDGQPRPLYERERNMGLQKPEDDYQRLPAEGFYRVSSPAELPLAAAEAVTFAAGFIRAMAAEVTHHCRDERLPRRGQHLCTHQPLR